MLDFLRTLIYLCVAGGLGYLAFHNAPQTMGTVGDTAFDLQGELFFPEFKDLSKATSLEVWDYEGGDSVGFKVEFKDGGWRIPSRYDYPADASEKMGELAAKLSGLRRQRLHSDQEAAQVECGVVNPQAEKDKGPEGRGRRVVVRDRNQQILADLIVGKELDTGGTETMRFARVPHDARNHIYSAAIDFEVSTDFSEWIETDLLQLEVADITSITVDAYHVDEDQLNRTGRLIIADDYQIELGQTDSGWVVKGQKEDQQASMASIDSMTEVLADLTIVDVRPFSERGLERRGFFVAGNPQDPSSLAIYSNEGELHVDLNKGVRYTIRFGEVAPSEEGEGMRRYAFITAEPRYEALSDPSDEESRKQADDLADQYSQRFSGWFYVLSAASFDSLRPDPEALLEPLEEDPGEGEAPPDFFQGSEGDDPWAIPAETGEETGETPEETGEDTATGETPEDTATGETPEDTATGETPEDTATGETPEETDEGTDLSEFSPDEGEAPDQPSHAAQLEELEAEANRLRDSLREEELPQPPLQLLQEIDSLLVQGELAQALAAAEAAVNEFPHDDYLRAVVLEIRERIANAPTPEEAPEGEVPTAVLEEIHALEESGQLPEALAKTEAALEQFPTDDYLQEIADQLRKQLGLEEEEQPEADPAEREEEQPGDDEEPGQF